MSWPCCINVYDIGVSENGGISPSHGHHMMATWCSHSFWTKKFWGFYPYFPDEPRSLFVHLPHFGRILMEAMAELLAEPDQASGSKRKATALAVHHEHCKRGKGKTPKNVYRWRFNGNMIYRWVIYAICYCRVWWSLISCPGEARKKIRCQIWCQIWCRLEMVGKKW